ncbi:MAG: ammonium transporter [Leptospiraceae bacterium]|nr:ammonium transporter [Leptospiraceae bacterium]
MDKSLADIIWVLISAALVLFMQAGFLCVESGLTRAKNSINVAIKNITDFGVATLTFWALGFGLMFGSSVYGLVGSDHFLIDFEAQEPWTPAYFIFQLVFCGTAATIVSGAVAERLSFKAYLINTTIISGLIYPLIGHWIWGGGLETASGTGWLAQLGFIDFAGSTVVHSTGGIVALASLLIVGARAGRFPPGQTPRKINGSNLPLAMLGGIILWFGWIGFNGGSTLALNAQVPGIVANTLLAGGAGLVAALIMSWLLLGYPEASVPLNGSLAGLVAITASCFAVTQWQALIIGSVAGVLVVPAEKLLERLQIDDAVGAIPVHLVAGIWGTLAVGLFGDPDILNTGLGRMQQIGVQALGILASNGFAFGLAFLLLSIVNRITPLRVEMEDEKLGLNISEHRATTELIDLFMVMDHQKKTGDLSADVPVEPFTEVGQIAERYNLVLDRVRTTLQENEEARNQLTQAFEAIAQERERAESLLLNVLPSKVAQELKDNPDTIAHSYSEVTVLFADIVGFTEFANRYKAESIVSLLNKIFSRFDAMVDRYGLEKIKTIGDAYMVVGGLPAPSAHHTEAVANFALDILDQLQRIKVGKQGQALQMRIGMNTGPAVAGVIGTKKFIYDIWGDSVNIASRMESMGLPGSIQMPTTTAERLRDKFIIRERGPIAVKGKGQLWTSLLLGRKPGYTFEALQT